jgi:spoIIIJ-associated protein
MSNQNAEEKSLDVSAKTVDEAIEQGLAQLKLPRDRVDVEIISEGKRGVFGLGAEEAYVRLRPRQARRVESSRVADVYPSKAAASLPDKPAPPEVKPPAQDSALPQEKTNEAETPTYEEKNVEEIAKRYLNDLLTRMGIEARVTSRVASDLVEAGEDPPLALNITGQDLGILIGRRSETLRALQYMLRLMVSKEMTSWQPIVVDVESYRVRRRRSLHRIAAKMAERAVNSGKRVVLEAMPAYERRVIHIALKDHPSVSTKSIGSDDNRKVTIIPK